MPAKSMLKLNASGKRETQTITRNVMLHIIYLTKKKIN